MLTGVEIKKRLNKDIKITPFNEKNINPNSYDLTLHNKLAVYQDRVIDAKINNAINSFRIPSLDDSIEKPFIMMPNNLYLARTVEYTETQNLIPCITGKSSLGRLGITVHQTAGFGDIGFKGYWTLEIVVSHPVKIYAGMKICQIYYHLPEGDITRYNGKYQNNNGLQANRID